ncbi:expressed unknown protein [Seminavis robusta]|uniref:Uncharacterized protein n=1 Tax=Seminavis robusta TaxID=568900 RepID=A0A9N8ENA6_9STRA|nr:expressed unknown protein [Seminavis robusta]|eukprot:Sro1379_g267700.1 n/a (346) ;mRNA; r:14559-15596
MARSTLSTPIAILSIIAGAGAFVVTQAVTKDTFEPILAACGNAKDYATMEDFVAQTGYHRYDKLAGMGVLDVFVCMITQFFVFLVERSPAGMLTWGTTIISAIPAMMLILLEAGRSGNRALLLWPTTFSLIAQFLGISVVFPLLWVPSYCFFANESGVVNLSLARSLVFWCLPFTLLSVAAFVLPVDSDEWTLVAGTLAGPLICLTGLIAWILGPPATPTQKDVAASAEAAGVSFGMGGILALLGWFYMIYTVLINYGMDYEALWKDLWTDAHPSIQFMSIDASVLWVGLVLHIASRKLSSVAEVLLLTPFFGPGAACCMALASLEMDRVPPVSNSSSDEIKKDK